MKTFLRIQPEEEAHHERRLKLSMQRALNKDRMRFCELEEFAMVPRGSNVGDMMFVPFGCRTPLLLKSVQREGKERYLIIGKAYVHGFMDNEVREMEMPSVLLTLI
jgi:hypothetical protein